MQELGTRLKLAMSIKAKQPLWERILEYFLLEANESRLNDTDWRLLYEFTRSNRGKMPSRELERRLIDHGFPAEYAREIICMYELIQVFTRPPTPVVTHILLDLKRRNRAQDIREA